MLSSGLRGAICGDNATKGERNILHSVRTNVIPVLKLAAICSIACPIRLANLLIERSLLSFSRWRRKTISKAMALNAKAEPYYKRAVTLRYFVRWQAAVALAVEKDVLR